MVKALLIETSGEFTEVSLSKKSCNDEIQKLLGGYMELVHPRRLPAPFIMLVDEEGLLKNKPLNLAGCYLYETDRHHSPIVGDILIMRERNYDFAGLEPQDFKVLFELISLAERVGG